MAIRYSYDDTTTSKRGIGDSIWMIDFTEAPLLQLFGFGSENLNKFDIQNWPSTKVEWLQDTMAPFESTIAEDLTDSEIDVDVATGHGVYFRNGDVVGVLDANGEVAEKMLVTSVSTDTLTVGTRTLLGTPTTHTTGATIVILTRAMPENSTYTTGYITTPTAPYNYTQILSQAVELSRTEAKLSRYGVEDQMAYQVAKLFDASGSEGKLAQLLHRTFYYGVRQQRTNQTTARGMMGGFETFVTAGATSTDHVFDKAQAAITKQDVHKVIRAARSSGGRITHIVTGAWGYEKLHSMYEDNTRTTEVELARGVAEMEMIRTPHGEVGLVFDFMCPQHAYYFVNADKIGWIPFDDFMASDIETMADGYAQDVVGEYTFVLANPESHGLIYGASTTK